MEQGVLIIMRLSEILVNTAHKALTLQHTDGSFPAGHNGPYHDDEKPVRNTAHWIITLLKAYRISGVIQFEDAAKRALDYLTDPVHRPGNSTFLCRISPGKDSSNGLIGQAWIIEALTVASNDLRDNAYAGIAKRLFNIHPFVEDSGVWKIVDIDGSERKIDPTFNHQLWFAAVGSYLIEGDDTELHSKIRRFMDCLSDNLRVRKDGLIFHYLKGPVLKDLVREPFNRLFRGHPSQRYKEYGYHAFNLHAFAMLKQNISDHSFWDGQIMRAILDFANSEPHIQGLNGNRYGYPYNPVGLEMAFSLQVFNSHFDKFVRSPSEWVEQQFKHCYDKNSELMSNGTEDGNTLAARIYEAVRLRDMEIRIDE
jgi:hypothetical protein